MPEIQSRSIAARFSFEIELKLVQFSRFVTVMFYLNEPEEGGETAFPLANNETYLEEVNKRDI